MPLHISILMASADLGVRASLLIDKHVDYIKRISEVCKRRYSADEVHHTAQATDSFEYYATEHFRLSGVYWGATALYLMGRLDALDAQAIVDWVMSCQHPCGGFGGSERHDPHLLSTLSAVQILALYDRMDLLDKDLVAKCMCRCVLCEILHRACLPQMWRPCSGMTGPLQATCGAKLIHGALQHSVFWLCNTLPTTKVFLLCIELLCAARSTGRAQRACCRCLYQRLPQL